MDCLYLDSLNCFKYAKAAHLVLFKWFDYKAVGFVIIHDIANIVQTIITSSRVGKKLLADSSYQLYKGQCFAMPPCGQTGRQNILFCSGMSSNALSQVGKVAC